ncbi:MAG: alpha/beta fold hydrolase [Thermoflexales bacterium]|nr:alpha/beta fold hydrolase [Thermoflexales bacterium]MDW8351386.1 alpha/beta fold hydrolase [Anaerolineae bacterium]
MDLKVSDEVRRAQRAFSFAGGQRRDIGVLCLHGFTGSPAEVRPLGEYLAEQGFAVEGPLLPKHGGMPHELKGATWRSWVACARDALNALADRCSQVFMAGLSMGGLITLHLAASECYRAVCNGKPSPLRGIVVMAAPTAVNDSRARLVRFARYFVPYYYPLKGANFNDPSFRASLRQRLGIKVDELNLDDPSVQKQIVQSVRIPVGAIHELLELNRLVLRELPRVTTPALFIQGRKDRVIAPDSADVLAMRVGSQDARVVWYDNSGHALPLEPDAPAMFKTIAEFIAQHSIVQQKA